MDYRILHIEVGKCFWQIIAIYEIMTASQVIRWDKFKHINQVNQPSEANKNSPSLISKIIYVILDNSKLSAIVLFYL